MLAVTCCAYDQELDLVDEKRAIVFVNTKRQCDNVYSKLESLGHREHAMSNVAGVTPVCFNSIGAITPSTPSGCTVLHGGKQQDQREVSIKGFRDDTFNILIATDVAGRGIDVPDVALVSSSRLPLDRCMGLYFLQALLTMLSNGALVMGTLRNFVVLCPALGSPSVINYDMPNSVEAYTHRIGRTGRAGKKGIAITFLTMGDQEVFYDLNRLLIDSKAAVPPEVCLHCQVVISSPNGLCLSVKCNPFDPLIKHLPSNPED
eukprot:1150034-Pelagomonas_calceolata.AAC.5